MRDHDIVVFGATGYTGRVVAEYLAGLGGVARIALAGRSAAKLSDLVDELDVDWPVIVADSADAHAMAVMARSTKVALTTVGPYAKYGMPLVAACAQSGTHYVDLTGEVLFMRDSIDAWDEVAKQTGARIVHACGFDSVPSDLGVLLLHEAAGSPLGPTVMAVRRLRGSISGGTIASGIHEMERAQSDRSIQRIVADPYALSPDRAQEPSPGDAGDQRGASYEQLLHSWAAPFPMAMVNARVVHRSNALLDYAYGKDFRYQEVILTGDGITGRALALAGAGAIGAGRFGLSQSWARGIVSTVLPKPGQGPSEEKRRAGGFHIEFRSRLSDDRIAAAEVTGQGDPGYEATPRMIAQAALCLVSTEGPGGVLTPASALGDDLVQRLRGADMTLRSWVDSEPT